MEKWREEYKRKTISAEEAAGLVKSGDRVAFTAGREAHSIGLALAARKEELKGVKVYVMTPGFDFGWYDPGWDDSFEVTVGWLTGTDQEAIDARRVDLDPHTLVPGFPEQVSGEADIVLTEVSPPDEKGFCSFGNSLFSKRRQIEMGKLVVAEVNERLIRTYGENYIHVSKIDYFVPHPSTGAPVGRLGTLFGREPKQPEPYVKAIAEYVAELIRDGDTIQIGGGRTTEALIGQGLLNNKQDLGWHSEVTPVGVVSLVRDGVITGKYKTIHRGKVVASAFAVTSREELEWVNNNPLFHLYDIEYTDDLRVVIAHDNFVAINNALSIDLRGQITADTLGTRVFSLAGGQIAFVVGALTSKGGRSIHVLPSTAHTKDGTVSRIVPTLPLGTIATIHPVCAQYVVTEYGIANLLGKTFRKRAEELIAIAHPDFRAELRKEAQRMFWP